MIIKTDIFIGRSFQVTENLALIVIKSPTQTMISKCFALTPFTHLFQLQS